MKEIIDISQEMFEATQKYYSNNTTRLSIKSCIEKIANGTPIPDNATNGDVIKAMFPSLEIANDGLINDNLTGIIAFYGGYGSPLPRGDNYFNRKWWNAPYKGVEE